MGLCSYKLVKEISIEEELTHELVAFVTQQQSNSHEEQVLTRQLQSRVTK